MSDPRDDQRAAAERDVAKRVDYQAEAVGGWTEQTRYGETTPPWADELIRQFRAARPEARCCPHLQQAPLQPSLWMANIPDMVACQGRGCERVLVQELERRLGHSLADEPSRCSACGRRAAVRGVSVGVGTAMLRGIICEQCEARTGADS